MYGNKENTDHPAYFVGGYGTTQTSVFSLSHRYPLTKWAGFAFNRIAPAAQAERHANKSATNRKLSGWHSPEQIGGKPTQALHPTAVQWQNKRVAETTSLRKNGVNLASTILSICGDSRGIASQPSEAEVNINAKNTMSRTHKKEKALSNRRGTNTKWVLSYSRS